MKFLFFTSAAALLPAPDCVKAPQKPNSTACARFQEFEAKFGRTYKSDEERLYRYYVFMENYVELERMKETAKGATFSYLSPLFDWSQSEFKARNNLNVSAMKPRQGVLSDKDLDDVKGAPHFDWRDYGAVNAVMDQGQCGSCWSFSTVANVEGVYFQQFGKLWKLSEEELVSCDHYDSGCNGGLPANTALWLMTKKVGLETEADYPYHGKVERCSLKSSLGRVWVSDFKWVDEAREDLMALALLKFGPLSVGINADPIMAYTGGVYQPNAQNPCDPSGVNHAVNAVGFGTDRGVDYWTVRNSWSANWGENGYFRLERGTGACGIDTLVSTVTGTHGRQEEEALIVA